GTWGVESMTPDNGYPMKIVGGTLPAEIWHADMQVVTATLPIAGFPPAPDKLYGPPTHQPVVTTPATPSVVGQNVTVAQIALENAGLAVTVQLVCQQAGNNAAPLAVWGQKASG